MSIPLKDFRLGLNESVHAVLDAVARASNRDMASVARDVLQAWADQKLHKHEMITRLTRDVDGTSRKERAK